MTNPRNKPFVIGVAGGCGSGKSTVTRQVLASIGPGMACVLFQDDVILSHGANGPAVDIITTKVKTLIRDLERA